MRDQIGLCRKDKIRHLRGILEPVRVNRVFFIPESDRYFMGAAPGDDLLKPGRRISYVCFPCVVFPLPYGFEQKQIRPEPLQFLGIIHTVKVQKIAFRAIAQNRKGIHDRRDAEFTEIGHSLSQRENIRRITPREIGIYISFPLPVG